MSDAVDNVVFGSPSSSMMAETCKGLEERPSKEMITASENLEIRLCLQAK